MVSLSGAGHIATQVYRRQGKGNMPTDIAVDKLNDELMRDLHRLKDWLYQRRTKIRQERDRAERRQKREGETARREAEQPALFDF